MVLDLALICWSTLRDWASPSFHKMLPTPILTSRFQGAFCQKRNAQNDWFVTWEGSRFNANGLVVSTPLKNSSQWEGLSHILWKNRKCPKPPTSQQSPVHLLSRPIVLKAEHWSKQLIDARNTMKTQILLEFCVVGAESKELWNTAYSNTYWSRIFKFHLIWSVRWTSIFGRLVGLWALNMLNGNCRSLREWQCKQTETDKTNILQMFDPGTITRHHILTLGGSNPAWLVVSNHATNIQK